MTNVVYLSDMEDFLIHLNEVFTPFKNFIDKYPKVVELKYQDEKGYEAIIDLDALEHLQENLNSKS